MYVFFIINDLSIFELIEGDHCIRILIVFDEMSFMTTSSKVENLTDKIRDLRSGILQLFCLQKLYKDQFNEEKNIILMYFMIKS